VEDVRMQRWRWVLVWFLGFGWTSGVVEASTVAVLDFDGYGVSFDDAALVSQGLRDAFLETGWQPLSDFDIVDRLSTGHEADVSSARRMVSGARQALDRGQASTALSKLRQAKKLHELAGSAVARRPEMADIAFFMGKAYLQLGRRGDARKVLVECLFLFPGYPDHRAPPMGSGLKSVFAEAQKAKDSESRRIMSSAEAANFQERLGVDAVVLGYLAADGTVFVRLNRGTTIAAEVTKIASEVPPFPGEPIYGQIIAELLGQGGAYNPAPNYNDSAPAYESTPFEADPFSSDPYQDGGGSDDFEALPNFEDDPYSREPARKDPGALAIRSPMTDPPPPEHEERESGFLTSTNEDSRIKSTGRMKYDKGPITHQPWFWGVVVGAVAAGGCVAAIVVLRDDGDGDTGTGQSEGETTSYTLTLETAG
jgi:hypothetical protein